MEVTHPRGLEVRILGPLEVIVGGRAASLGGPRQRAVLALLALRANHLVPTDVLVDELWDGQPPKAAETTVRAYVSHLRRELEPDRLPSAPPRVLQTRPSGYELHLDAGALDATEFERRAADGRAALAAGRAEDAATVLRAALELWRGPALADFAGEPWARGTTARLDELHAAAVEARIEADVARGLHADVVAELEALVAQHPRRERLWAHLMLALYRSGRQADALRAFRSARTLLVDEHGIDPGDELQRLEVAILNHAPELEPAPAAAAQGGDAGRGDGLFVGREPELAELRRSLAEAVAGQGRLVLVTGEAGVGKTRLVREALAAARSSGAEVLWGRAWEEEGAPAFWPWTQVLRTMVSTRDEAQVRTLVPDDTDASVLAQLVPTLATTASVTNAAPALDPAQARFHLFDAVVRTLKRAAAGHPVVVVVDDLHRADLPSLRLLEFLARHVDDAGLLVVATYRDHEVADDAGLAAVLGALAREPVARRLRLEGLGVEDAARLVTHIGGEEPSPALVTALRERTGGNPFYLGELAGWLAARGRLDVDTLDPTVPDGVLDAVRERLAQLPPEGRELLIVAAVTGAEFDLRVVEEAGQVDPGGVIDLVDRAAAAGLVTELPSLPMRYRFTHALVRDALYLRLSGTRRARLHHRIGDAIEKVHGRELDDHLAELAHHFLEAAPDGTGGQALSYAVRAGQRAMEIHAYEEAARLFDVALPHADKEQRGEVLVKLAEARIRSDDPAGAKLSFLAAADAARVVDDAALLARSVLGSSDPLEYGVHDQELLQSFDEALTALGDADPALRSQLLARNAMARFWAPSPTAGPRGAERPWEALVDEAVAIAHEVGDARVLAIALHARHYVHWAPEHLEERLELAGEIVRLGQAAGVQELILDGGVWRIADLAELGDFDQVDREIERYGRLAAELHVPSYTPWTLICRGMRTLMSGGLSEAEQSCFEAMTLGLGVPGGVVLSCSVQLVILRREQGRLAELEGAIRQALESVPAVWTFRAPLALLLAQTGRVDEARQELEHLGAGGFGDLAPMAGWLSSMVWLAEVCELVGDASSAKALYDLLAPYENRFATVFAIACVGPVAFGLGVLASAQHDWEAACRHLTNAETAAERVGALPALARARFHHARVLAARDGEGDRAAAGARLQVALEAATTLGMEDLRVAIVGAMTAP